jgi:hypothetical protein
VKIKELYIKDILRIVVVPFTLAVLALLSPTIQPRARRRAFCSLIFRELEENSPYPENHGGDGWWEHEKKEYVIRRFSLSRRKIWILFSA